MNLFGKELKYTKKTEKTLLLFNPTINQIIKRFAICHMKQIIQEEAQLPYPYPVSSDIWI